jgi:hypothetical protein
MAALVLERIEFTVNVTDQNRQTGVLHRLHLARSKFSDIYAQNFIRHPGLPPGERQHRYIHRVPRENDGSESPGYP